MDSVEQVNMNVMDIMGFSAHMLFHSTQMNDSIKEVKKKGKSFGNGGDCHQVSTFFGMR